MDRLSKRTGKFSATALRFHAAKGCVACFLLLLTGIGGCNRQDNEALARIGRKFATQARSVSDEMTAKLDLPWKSIRLEPTLQEKIQDRLRWENTLSESTFEVHVKEKAVELKGKVRTALQKQRAIELAETVTGVARVVDSIEVGGENAQ